MKITAITCVKNEGPFLLEWVAFNRVIGVTDFLIYSNDCDDGTAELLDALATAGLVVHLPNPAKGRNIRSKLCAMRAARISPRTPIGSGSPMSMSSLIFTRVTARFPI